MDPSVANRFFRMHRTVLQMLNDRGYAVEPQDLEMDFETFQLSFSNAAELNAIYVHNDQSVQRIKTRFDIPDEKFNNQAVQKLVMESNQDQINRCIIILPEGAHTPAALKNLAKTKSAGKHFEVFSQKEVLINITEHELVPRHRPLSPQQKDELLARYKLNESQLPRILATDPVVRYFGVDVGTVMEITRRSETAGRYVTYRLVC
jgi:DNA-directed RNA polymerase I, II, and III subunit RPABC1